MYDQFDCTSCPEGETTGRNGSTLASECRESKNNQIQHMINIFVRTV